MSKKKLPTTLSMPEKVKYDEANERRYQAEDGLRILQRAEECRKDKQLMKDIKALAKQQMKALGKI